MCHHQNVFKWIGFDIFLLLNTQNKKLKATPFYVIYMLPSPSHPNFHSHSHIIRILIQIFILIFFAFSSKFTSHLLLLIQPICLLHLKVLSEPESILLTKVSIYIYSIKAVIDIFLWFSFYFKLLNLYLYKRIIVTKKKIGQKKKKKTCRAHLVD